KLLIVTGQRLREIGDLEWAEINWQDRQIELPETPRGANKGRTKNGMPHLVPLSAPALAILRAIPRQEGQRLVFLGHRGRGMTSYSRQKDKLDKAIPTAPIAAGKPPNPKRTLPHNRPTSASGTGKALVARGEDGKLEKYRFCLPHVVEMLISHVSGHKAGVAGTYNVEDYLEERQAALEQWGAHLVGLVDGQVMTRQDATPETLMTSAPSRTA